MRFNTKNTNPFLSMPTIQDRMVSIPIPIAQPGATRQNGYGTAFLRRQDTTSQYFGTGPYPRAELLVAYWEWCTETYNFTHHTPPDGNLGASPTTLATAMPTTKEKLAGPTPASDGASEFVANSTGTQYRVSWVVSRWLAESLLEKTVAKIVSVIDYSGSIVREANEAYSLDMIGPYLSVTDIDKMAASVARTVSNLIRNPPGNGGGNSNTTTVLGQAWGQGTYIRVRREWPILALLETVLSAVLLLTTILLDRRSGYPLLKSSALGLLFHGLEGWVPGDLRGYVKGVETATKLEDVARVMDVRFTTGEDGNLRFVRSVSQDSRILQGRMGASDVEMAQLRDMTCQNRRSRARIQEPTRIRHKETHRQTNT